VALAFICGVALLFALLLVCEGQPGSDEPLRPAGLLRWLISGNWTAKLGALLLTIGSGALLRYLMLNLSYPAALKMLTGAALAALFGVAAALLAARPGRRALSLALTGAALAVAYLTAYSAYEFFHFVADPQALGLLFIVACVATVLAITRRSVSLAVLAMAGAYLAPAFALHGNDPVPVYGYYAIASLITLFPVATPDQSGHSAGRQWIHQPPAGACRGCHPAGGQSGAAGGARSPRTAACDPARAHRHWRRHLLQSQQRPRP